MADILKNQKKIAAVLVTVLICSGPVSAWEWVAYGGGDLRWFDWREHQGNKQLLMEVGPLASPVLQLRLQHAHFFTRAEVAWGGGMTRYNGHLQTGPSYDAGAWEEILDSAWRVGWQEEQGEVHLGFMQRDWRRLINGSTTVASTEERYRWRLATLGAETDLFNLTLWQNRLAFDVGVPLSSYQKVYGDSVDDFALEPGKGIYWRLAFPFRPRQEGKWLPDIEPYYQQQGMKQSDAVLLTKNGVPQGILAYQPASVRRELGVTLLWRIGH